MAHAFPHDELRPISATHTDSLVEIGATAPTRTGYNGVALTLIDSLDTLAVLGNATEFAWAVRWISDNVSFDLDIEVRAHTLALRIADLLALFRTPRLVLTAVPRRADGRSRSSRRISACSVACSRRTCSRAARCRVPRTSPSRATVASCYV